MEKTLKLWWSPISTKLIITFYLSSLNTKRPLHMTLEAHILIWDRHYNAVGLNLYGWGLGLEQAHVCGGVNSVCPRNSKILVSLKTKINVYWRLQITSVYHSHVIMEPPVMIMMLVLIVIVYQGGIWQHIVAQVNMTSITSQLYINLCLSR